MTTDRTMQALLIAVGMLAAGIVAIVQPLFYTADNLLNILRQSVPLVILAVGQSYVLVSRGLDLSQGGVVVATSVSLALLSQQMDIALAIPIAVLMGAVIGLFNGGLVAGLGLSPFVVTLGVGSILQGAALVASSGQPVFEVPSGFTVPYYGSVAGIPIPFIVGAGIMLVAGVVLDSTVLGRCIRAVGSNPRAAFLSGLAVKRTELIAYAMCAATTAIGAIMLAARISSGHPTAGSDLALQAVAAAVIGGVSLFGGRGSVYGAAAGAVFLTAIANALNLLNVSSFLQLIAVGMIIIVAAIIDKLRRHGAQQIGGSP
jgi:ribose transport system permease protein